LNEHDIPALHRYGTLVRRNWLLILIIVVIVTAAAVIYPLQKTAIYGADSTVLVNRQSLANQLSGSSADVGLQQQSFQQVLATQARLARGSAVVSRVSRQLHGALRTEDLKSNSSVEVDPSTDLLLFSVRDADPALARAAAAAYANAYVAYRLELDTSALRRALDDLDSSIARVPESSKGSTGLRNSLETSRQQLQTRLALQTANAQVVSSGDAATRVGPSPILSGLAGLIAALLLAAAAVALREVLDTRVRRSEEIEELLGVPILSRIPRYRVAGLATRDDVASPAAEAFRILRTNLTFSLQARKATTVVATSSAPAEGKSVSMANLALSFAASGKRTVLVDLDLRRPSQTTLFQLRPGPGFTSVVIGEATLSEALRTVPIKRERGDAAEQELRVVPSGPLPLDPSEFLELAAVGEIIASLREDFDVVLIDGPPVVGFSDPLTVAGYVDAVLAFSMVGEARRPILRELARILPTVPAPVIGLVVVGEATKLGGGYAAYGYADR
jgi:succinoglycan biosynthesis transport protein ExoP